MADAFTTTVPMTLSAGALIDTNGFDVTVAGNITGNVGGCTLTKAGGGTLTLTGSNSYPGETEVTGGTLALTGTGQLSANSLIVGSSSTCTFSQSGGTNTCSQIFLGQNVGENGTYALSSTGCLSWSSGSVTIPFWLWGPQAPASSRNPAGPTSVPSADSVFVLGDGRGSNGKYQLSGGFLSVAGTTLVGNGGMGTLTQSGGTNASGVLVLGGGAAAESTSSTAVLSTSRALQLWKRRTGFVRAARWHDELPRKPRRGRRFQRRRIIYL